jgi:uncharacterized caspase-like protein
MARHIGCFPRRGMLWLAGAGLLGCGALLPAASTLAAGPRTERRIALVIGNGAYKSAPLKNPTGDAEAVAASLKQLGYDVVLRRDTGLFELVEALREFSVRASDSAVRLLFYAGHGIQARGRNYLLPVDVEPQSEDEIAAKAADVGQFIDRLSAIRHGLNIVVLDACRVNPFSGGVFVTPAGLAPLDAPVGTLVAFSTAPNGVALDGPVGAHSIYAKHLLTHLPTPGLPIEQLFKRVRISVADETQRLQVPWESSSLTSDYCFKPGTQGRCG